MAVKRIVDTSFWTDSKVDDFSPEDKYFMLYLLTSPFTKQLGIFEISVKQAAFQMGWQADAFKVLLERFENKYHMIRYSEETGEIAIKNFLRHSIMKGGKPVEDCIRQDIERVKNKDLLKYVFSSLYGKEGLNVTVKKIVDEYMENDNDKHNDNDNDNDNDSTVAVSCDDSGANRLTAPTKPVKHKYGEYKNVLLTDEELAKLQAEYADWKERIERLSSYVASTGKRYKSHYATIRNWARKDAEKKPASKAANMLDESYQMMKEWSES